jgi:hypothetical protein
MTGVYGRRFMIAALSGATIVASMAVHAIGSLA